MMTQTMLDPTDETRRTMPCPTRLVHMATIARIGRTRDPAQLTINR